jgi:dTDP-4-amino-4,6-dideoxygalactose transaminase
MPEIPFNRPFVSDSAYQYLRQAVANGHLSGDGPFTRKCHDLLETLLGVPKVLLTTSCTHALEMSALLLDISPGDEVVIPSFTFVSTVNAFVLRGAKPVFADIRPDTLNLDEARLPVLLTPRTRAIVPVHYAGVGCELDAITLLGARYGIPVVEDNAQGLMGKYRGRHLGTFGSLATLSFHETKNFTCGEGGALLINDPSYVERAEVLREKGTNRNRFFRGEVDKYTWVDLGSSFLPSDALAALLLAQLEMREQIQQRRRHLWYRYIDELRDWAEGNGVRLPIVPPQCEQPFHLFYLILPSLELRQGLISHLQARGIKAIFHYQPLHLSDMGRRLGGRPGACPVTEGVSDRLVRLPLYYELTDAEQCRVIEATRAFRAEWTRIPGGDPLSLPVRRVA